MIKRIIEDEISRYQEILDKGEFEHHYERYACKQAIISMRNMKKWVENNDVDIALFEMYLESKMEKENILAKLTTDQAITCIADTRYTAYRKMLDTLHNRKEYES